MNTSLALDERGLVVACPHCRQHNRLGYERLGELPRCATCRTELRLPDEPIEAKSDTEFQALTARSALPVLVDFWAPWCGPCKMNAPEVAKIAAEGMGRWVVLKVNTEELPAPAQQYRVNAIPLFVFFRHGREIARQAGALPATSLRRFIESHLNLAPDDLLRDDIPAERYPIVTVTLIVLRQILSSTQT